MTNFLVHSDARASLSLSKSNPSSLKSKKILIENSLSFFRKVSEGRDVILPAFNYDFSASLFFDVACDVAQVGAIPEFARRTLSWRRNSTPVFSFLSETSLLPSDNFPFSADSVLGSLVKGGEILLFGVGFERMTFLHFIEDQIDVPYRYRKRFDGSAKHLDGKLRQAFVEFHVRPTKLKVNYDFTQIGQFLLEEKAAIKKGNFSYLVDAKKTFEVMVQKYEENALFGLSAKSRDAVEAKLDHLGRPFQLEDFE